MSYGQKSRCDPGPCGEIPGLVYNPENHQCAWPDEMGCSLRGQTCEYRVLGVYYRLVWAYLATLVVFSYPFLV